MQDIMSAIIRNRNLLNKQYKEVESELDYLHLEGDPVAIQETLESIQEELDKASFVNCTSQWLSIEGIGVIPPSGILPMVFDVFVPASVVGLPNPVEGITFIVSGEVMDALSSLPAHMQRPDVFASDTESDAIRNYKGHIVAVRGLVQ